MLTTSSGNGSGSSKILVEKALATMSDGSPKFAGPIKVTQPDEIGHRIQCFFRKLDDRHISMIPQEDAMRGILPPSAHNPSQPPTRPHRPPAKPPSAPAASVDKSVARPGSQRAPKGPEPKQEPGSQPRKPPVATPAQSGQERSFSSGPSGSLAPQGKVTRDARQALAPPAAGGADGKPVASKEGAQRHRSKEQTNHAPPNSFPGGAGNVKAPVSAAAGERIYPHARAPAATKPAPPAHAKHNGLDSATGQLPSQDKKGASSKVKMKPEIADIFKEVGSVPQLLGRIEESQFLFPSNMGRTEPSAKEMAKKREVNSKVHNPVAEPAANTRRGDGGSAEMSLTELFGTDDDHEGPAGAQRRRRTSSSSSSSSSSSTVSSGALSSSSSDSDSDLRKGNNAPAQQLKTMALFQPPKSSPTKVPSERRVTPTGASLNASGRSVSAAHSPALSEASSEGEYKSADSDSEADLFVDRNPTAASRGAASRSPGASERVAGECANGLVSPSLGDSRGPSRGEDGGPCASAPVSPARGDRSPALSLSCSSSDEDEDVDDDVDVEEIVDIENVTPVPSAAVSPHAAAAARERSEAWQAYASRQEGQAGLSGQAGGDKSYRHRQDSGSLSDTAMDMSHTDDEVEPAPIITEAPPPPPPRLSPPKTMPVLPPPPVSSPLVNNHSAFGHGNATPLVVAFPLTWMPERRRRDGRERALRGNNDTAYNGSAAVAGGKSVRPDHCLDNDGRGDPPGHGVTDEEGVGLPVAPPGALSPHLMDGGAGGERKPELRSADSTTDMSPALGAELGGKKSRSVGPGGAPKRMKKDQPALIPAAIKAEGDVKPTGGVKRKSSAGRDSSKSKDSAKLKKLAHHIPEETAAHVAVDMTTPQPTVIRDQLAEPLREVKVEDGLDPSMQAGGTGASAVATAKQRGGVADMSADVKMRQVLCDTSKRSEVYRDRAKELKAGAEGGKEPMEEKIDKLDCILFFVQQAIATERETSGDAAQHKDVVYKLYNEIRRLTVHWLKQFEGDSANLPRRKREVWHILCLWTCSTVMYRLYKLKKNEVASNRRTFDQYMSAKTNDKKKQQQPPVQQPGTRPGQKGPRGGPSEPSPCSIPSPAGSAASMSSGTSDPSNRLHPHPGMGGYMPSATPPLPSGYPANTTPVPYKVHTAVEQFMMHSYMAITACDYWENGMVRAQAHKDFFGELELTCGRLEMMSGLQDMVSFVRTALYHLRRI